MGVNGEALQLHAIYKKIYKKPYFLLQVMRESVSVLQVTWESISVLQVTRESVSGTTSHVRCVWMRNEIKGTYDKIIITIVPSYTGKNITRLWPLALLLMLRTRNNTDGNKLVIFSNIAWYYCDTYIVSSYIKYGLTVKLTPYVSPCSGLKIGRAWARVRVLGQGDLLLTRSVISLYYKKCMHSGSQAYIHLVIVSTDTKDNAIRSFILAKQPQQVE